MKHNNTFYIQLPREICQENFNYLSDSAFRLYVMLKEEEQRFIDDKEVKKGKNPHELFFRTDEDLAQDLNWSVRKVQRAKQELRNTGLLYITKGHFFIPSTQKYTKKKVTIYKIY